MSLPLQIQLFDAFLGSEEGIHSVILPDIFSSGGSQNLWIDKYGRAKKISGYDNQNVAAVTTNTGLAATSLRALFAYRSTGATTTRQVIGLFQGADGGTEYEFWYSTNSGVNWTFIADLATATLLGQYPDFAQFGNTLYVSTGKVAPRKWDGTTWSTTGRTQSPTPTTVESASVGTLIGNYRYKLVSVINDGTRQAASAASTVLPVTSFQVTVTWTADSNTNVVGYEIYRTTGTGSVYYFVTYSDGRTSPVSYTDNIADIDILENRILAEHGDAPPTVYFCEPHKQRMWWGNVDANPTRVYWSDPGLPEDVLADNYLTFSDSETMGDTITGMTGNYEGRLVVWTERAVWTVSGTGEVIGNVVDWTRTRTNAQIGAVTHRAVARVPAGARFVDQTGKVQTTSTVTLAYLTPLLDIRLFDGDNDITISYPLQDLLSTLNYAQRAKATVVTDTPRNEITWMFAAGSATENDTAITWNYRWGVCYRRSWPFATAIEVETSTDASILLAGEPSRTVGGFCYLLWTGNSSNGTAINAEWMTKTLHGLNEEGQPAISHLKRWRWLDLLFETDQNTSLTVEWLRGYAEDDGAAEGSVTATPAASGIDSAGADDVTSAGGVDYIVVGQETTPIRAILQTSTGERLHDTGIRIRVGDNASNGSWSLEAMQLAYQILPGLQRRMQG